MENHPSTDARDRAIHAALRDAASLFAMVSDEFRASYRGARRDVYVRTLAGYLVDVGGTLEEAADSRFVARIGARTIVLTFD